MAPTFVHQLISSIDFGAVGGSLLMLDMILFSVLAVYWKEAGRRRLFDPKRPTRKR